MKKNVSLFALLFSFTCCFSQKVENEFISLFDGKTFTGWKVNTENPTTFSIEDGMIKVAGDRTHLFYEGTLRTMISRILN